MNLYLLKRPDEETSYGEMCACVVRAASSRHARNVAKAACKDEGVAVWDKAVMNTLAHTVHGPAEVVLADVLEA